MSKAAAPIGSLRLRWIALMAGAFLGAASLALGAGAAVGQAPSSSSAATVPAPPPGPQRISFAFRDVSAVEAIAQLRWLAGVPIVYANPRDQRITLSASGVAINEALDAVCGALDCEWISVGRTYVVRPAAPEPLLAPSDLRDRTLYADRQALDAAQLILALPSAQIARLARGDVLSYQDLTPVQRQIADAVYARLVGAARAGWLEGVQIPRAAPVAPPADLAVGVRGYMWRVEQPATPPPAASPPVDEESEQ